MVQETRDCCVRVYDSRRAINAKLMLTVYSVLCISQVVEAEMF